MNISEVRVGDYVYGFGVVDQAMAFYKEVACDQPHFSNIKYNKKNFRSTNYAHMNTLEMSKCYRKELDNVVLVGAGVRRTYPADATVLVYRSKAA